MLLKMHPINHLEFKKKYYKFLQKRLERLFEKKLAIQNSALLLMKQEMNPKGCMVNVLRFVDKSGLVRE